MPTAVPRALVALVASVATATPLPTSRERPRGRRGPEARQGHGALGIGVCDDRRPLALREVAVDRVRPRPASPRHAVPRREQPAPRTHVQRLVHLTP